MLDKLRLSKKPTPEEVEQTRLYMQNNPGEVFVVHNPLYPDH